MPSRPTTCIRAASGTATSVRRSRCWQSSGGSHCTSASRRPRTRRLGSGAPATPPPPTAVWGSTCFLRMWDRCSVKGTVADATALHSARRQFEVRFKKTKETRAGVKATDYTVVVDDWFWVSRKKTPLLAPPYPHAAAAAAAAPPPPSSALALRRPPTEHTQDSHRPVGSCACL